MSKPDNPYAEIYAGFLRATAEHAMVVQQDEHLYRHLRIAKPGENIWSWDIVTWPGYLATSGDVAGGYIFTRSSDMIEFFDRLRYYRSYYSDGAPYIDFRYWEEKLHGSRWLDVKMYSEYVFLQHVRDALDQHDDFARSAIAAIRKSNDDEAEHLTRKRAEILDTAKLYATSELAAREWLQQGPQREVFGTDAASEWDLSTYGAGFLIACYCIDLSVQLYRKATQARVQAGAVVHFAQQGITQELKAIVTGRYTEDEIAMAKIRIADAEAGIHALAADPTIGMVAQ